MPKSNYYTEIYLQRARYVNIPWMYKALRNYRKVLGSVEIKGILIPKSIVKGETAQLKKLSYRCKNSQMNYQSLQNKLNSLCTGLAAHSENLRKISVTQSLRNS